MDAGTGGGFPGIPLAVLFPQVEFTLVDSIEKKIRVVESITKEIGLKNAICIRERYENLQGQFDFIMGRAVASLPEFFNALSGKILKKNMNDKPNGMIYLKGGDFNDEIEFIHADHSTFELRSYFDEPFFETKKIIHLYR